MNITMLFSDAIESGSAVPTALNRLLDKTAVKKPPTVLSLLPQATKESRMFAGILFS
jgi:hypothetical protein